MRPIDADELKRRIIAFCTAQATTFLSADGIVTAINHADTVDAVPVVRCKDCKHHYDCGVHFCDRLGMDCPDDSDFFYSYGVRKDGDSDGKAEE